MKETAFWILTALTAGRRHGYAILNDVEKLSNGAVALRVTTLYASLERLEREGRIHTASEEIVDGRARRYYDITDSGRTQLAAEAERLAQRAAVAQARMAKNPASTTQPASATGTVGSPASASMVLA